MDILRNKTAMADSVFLSVCFPSCSSELEVRYIGSDLLNAYHDYKWGIIHHPPGKASWAKSCTIQNEENLFTAELQRTNQITWKKYTVFFFFYRHWPYLTLKTLPYPKHCVCKVWNLHSKNLCNIFCLVTTEDKLDHINIRPVQGSFLYLEYNYIN